ncbi:hypothetical protein V5J73_08750 [Flavobacterium sp. KS-LB2]|uniref:hypothetical protein n=1 Tax=Flavobacterium sp. KS-LB2 TaxID=3120525 RepID=UPI0030CE83D3
MNNNTKNIVNIPSGNILNENISILNISNREKVTVLRFEAYAKCATVLREYFYLGFKSYEAFRTIVIFYYPDINSLKLKKFWNCLLLDKEVAVCVESVLEILKKK